jgi:glycosyltransferase involved in cell wall biosynthesis
MRVLFLTSLEHPQIRFEAENLTKYIDLTYIVIPFLDRKSIFEEVKCLINNFPHISLALLKLRIPPIPSILTHLLIANKLLCNEKLRHRNIDLIYAHWLFPAGLVGLILSKIYRCKIVSVIWGYDIQVLQDVKGYGIYNWSRVISRIVIEKSDLTIVNHKIHKILAYNLVNQKYYQKILYIPPGIPDFSSEDIDEATTEELRKKLGFSLEKFRDKVVLYGPHLKPIYGIREFLKAARIVSRQVENAVFILTGDGELKEEVIKFIRENNLESRVYLVGQISHESMKILYKLSTLVCDLAYPGTGTTTLEAFCFGKPVIGIKSPKTVIVDGFNGFTIEKGDHEKLAIYIMTILKNEDYAKKLSLNARKTFVEKYHIDKRIKLLLKIFSMLVKNHYYKDLSFELR